MKTLTTNQYYGGLNRRFDKRIARLVCLGFRQVTNEFGCFMVRTKYARTQSLSQSLVMYADQRAYFDRLRSYTAY